MEPVIIEEVFNVSVDVVWRAITERDQMVQWFFEQIEDFKPEVGYETEFTVHFNGTDYPHCWRILDARPSERISYSWRYRGFIGNSTVFWILSEADGGTKLTFRHEVTEPFPPDDPAFTREACQGGWDYFISQRLRDYLDKLQV